MTDIDKWSIDKLDSLNWMDDVEIPDLASSVGEGSVGIH